MPDEFETRFKVPRPARVFPLLPNSKKPAIDHWPEQATDDMTKLRRWFDGQFKDHNIGVATGKGLIVVDCDVKDGRNGLESLELLDSLGLPTGYRVVTPSGGLHVYLLVDEAVRNSVDRLADFPGIDIRGDGGYVVGPGSSINGKMYAPIR
jgi:hypothetical protein